MARWRATSMSVSLTCLARLMMANQTLCMLDIDEIWGLKMTPQMIPWMTFPSPLFLSPFEAGNKKDIRLLS